MLTLSNADKEKLSHNLADVWFVRMQLENTGAKVSQEEAYVAWSEHSRRNNSEWISVERNRELIPDMVQAHQMFKASMIAANIIASPKLARSGPNFEYQSSQPSNPYAREMQALGYSVPKGEISEQAAKTMNHIVGRYKNIAYMAGEIDRLDGIPAYKQAPYDKSGAKQFHHLRDTVSKNNPGIDQCYVALRRLQRDGEHEKLKAGVALLVMADQRIIGHTDALKGMGNEGILPDDGKEVGHKEPILIRSKGVEPKETPMLEHAHAARGSSSER